LLIISIVVSAVLFFLVKIKTGKGKVGFIAEIYVGWLEPGWTGLLGTGGLNCRTFT